MEYLLFIIPVSLLVRLAIYNLQLDKLDGSGRVTEIGDIGIKKTLCKAGAAFSLFAIGFYFLATHTNL